MNEKLVKIEQIVRVAVAENKKYDKDAEKQQKIIDELIKKAKAEGKGPLREGFSEGVFARKYRRAVIARRTASLNKHYTEAAGFKQIAKLLGY